MQQKNTLNPGLCTTESVSTRIAFTLCMHNYARYHLKAAAEHRACQLKPTDTAIIEPGALVYQQNHHLGRHKIQNVWVYRVVRHLDDLGRVYKICPKDGTGEERNVHRAELR